MTMIQTLRGPIGLNHLGQTMMHEHVFFGNWGEERWREPSVRFASQELAQLVAHGAQTLVDVGPHPARDIAWYRELAPQLALNIVVSTGFYLEHLVSGALHDQDEAQCITLFLRELTSGIGDSGIRAALVKVAANRAELTPWEIKVFRAAARVQRETGVPICTHACEGARSQFDLLLRAGADPERIYLSHVEAEFGWEGRTLREEARYLEAIAREGGSLYFNNFGFEFDTPAEDLMYLMHTLADKGLAHRILFGVDANYVFDAHGRAWWEAEQEHPAAGERTYAYTYTHAIPLMKRWGLTEQHLHAFLVDNPRRMFSTTRI